MRSIYATLITLGSLTGALWFQVYPQGATDCQFPTFRFQSIDDSIPVNVEAAKFATLKFCTLVKANPMY